MLCSIVCDLAVARSGSIAIARKFEYSRFMATVDLALALLSVCLLVSQSVVYYYTEACLRNSERNVLSKEQHYKLELPPFLPHGRR